MPSLRDGKVGQPTVRTAEAERKILDALRAGNTKGASCQYAGISEDVFSRWRRDDAEFLAKVIEAEATAEVKMELVIQQAAFERDVVTTKTRRYKNEEGEMVTEVTSTVKKEFDWKAAAFWLERRRFKEWGRRVDLTSEGQAITNNIMIVQLPYNERHATSSSPILEAGDHSAATGPAD